MVCESDREFFGDVLFLSFFCDLSAYVESLCDGARDFLLVRGRGIWGEDEGHSDPAEFVNGHD